MKNVHDVLRQKEVDLARLQNEIEALRLVIPLLTDERPTSETEGQEPQEQEAGSVSTPESTGTDGPTFLSIGHSESSFWKRRR